MGQFTLIGVETGDTHYCYLQKWGRGQHWSKDIFRVFKGVEVQHTGHFVELLVDLL
jgi:hypothetical protein